MAQSSTTTSTQIIDTQNNVVSVDSSGRLNVKEPTVQDILQQDTEIWQSINDAFENLLQQKLSSASALPVSIAKDNVVNTAFSDSIINATITTSTTIIALEIGGYVDIPINGHSMVAVQTGKSINNIGITAYYSVDGENWIQPSNSIIAITGYPPTSGIAGYSTETTYNSEFLTTGPATFFMLCSGYSKIRLVFTTFTDSMINVMAVASVPDPTQVLTAFLNNPTNFFANSITTAGTGGTTANSNNANGNILQKSILNLRQATLIINSGTMTVGQTIYGLNVYNPNDFPVYLIFWDANLQTGLGPAATQALFRINNQNISYSIIIPPADNFTIPFNFYGLYSSTYYLFMAASMINVSYVSVPLGLNVTIFIAK